YTGRGARTGSGAVDPSDGSGGPYMVDFVREIRPDDVIVSGRLGFKTLTRYRLKQVVVSTSAGKTPGTIRSYQLHYAAGDFKKSLVDRIEVYGAAGSAFYSHSFEYTRKDFSNPRVPFDAF